MPRLTEATMTVTRIAYNSEYTTEASCKIGSPRFIPS